MKKKQRVVIAMSGGVDSSVAAGMLKEQGFEVIGLSMQLWDYAAKESLDSATTGSCCSLDDLNDARRVAEELEIKFYVVNMEKDFTREVIEYFVESYLAGLTPNPCVKCNEIMKFQALMRKARELEADFLATGHYARIINDGGKLRLLKAIDDTKDQTYFLFTMTQDELRRTLFPLGGLTKKEVRKQAAKFGLRVAHKDESQEICFVEDGNYADFIAAYSPEVPTEGDMVDPSGQVVGRHRGLFRYTVGQRKGLNITDGHGPYYVLALDVPENRLVVGQETGLYSSGLLATGLNWINDAPGPAEELIAKIRYRHPGVKCRVRQTDNGVEVKFDKPEKAVAPGQAVVFYSGDEVLGGGWITGQTGSEIRTRG